MEMEMFVKQDYDTVRFIKNMAFEPPCRSAITSGFK